MTVECEIVKAKRKLEEKKQTNKQTSKQTNKQKQQVLTAPFSTHIRGKRGEADARPKKTLFHVVSRDSQVMTSPHSLGVVRLAI